MHCFVNILSFCIATSLAHILIGQFLYEYKDWVDYHWMSSVSVRKGGNLHCLLSRRLWNPELCMNFFLTGLFWMKLIWIWIWIRGVRQPASWAFFSLAWFWCAQERLCMNWVRSLLSMCWDKLAIPGLIAVFSATTIGLSTGNPGSMFVSHIGFITWVNRENILGEV